MSEGKQLMIHIVGGSTGEYSDRHEWIVDAWHTLEQAQARVAKLDALMQELHVDVQGNYAKQREAIAAMKAHADGDPFFSIDYTGTSYYISSCPLKGAA